MTPELRARVEQVRVARLATVEPNGRPHLVPLCFVLEGDVIYSAVDEKPKRSKRLKRLANIRANPEVCVLVDHYEEDWSRLWWARLRGRAEIHEQGPERERALELLREKYQQYRVEPPTGAAIVVRVEEISAWEAGAQVSAGFRMATHDDRHLLSAIELARRARANGNHPFGALLVDANGNAVLEAENTVVTERDCTGHAETNLMRTASKRFDPGFLQQCTLYTSTEPCAMCAGAIYWGNVRSVVFGLSQAALRGLVGSDPLAISCRDVFARGEHEVRVRGPHLEDEARAVHEDFWG